MERVVVTRTGDDVWSVSHEGRAISVHATEEQALSAAFALASDRQQEGFEAVVVVTAGSVKRLQPLEGQILKTPDAFCETSLTWMTMMTSSWWSLRSRPPPISCLVCSIGSVC